VTRVIETTMPERRGGAGDEGRRSRYRGTELLHLTMTYRVSRCFTKQPDGLNSVGGKLMKRDEILNKMGETRTL
jgi:hypothetical protein